VSARDELVGLMVRHGVPGLLIRGGLDAALEEHAHELAEKIRNADAPGELVGFYGSELSAYLEGYGDAADHIDPEVRDD